MEIALKDLLDLLTVTEFVFEFVPDGSINYRYNNTPESYYQYKCNLMERSHSEALTIRIVESSSEDGGTVIREYKDLKTLQSAKSLMERKVSSIRTIGGRFTTSSTGRTSSVDSTLEIAIV